jgi:hypothetical protein
MFCSPRREHGSDPRQGGCDLPGLYAEACETAVVNLLTMMEIPADDKERVLAELEAKPRRNGVSIASLEGKLERLAWLFREGDIGRDDFRRRKE